MRLRTLVTLALAVALAGCAPAPADDVNRNQPAGRQCDESCTNDPDTITVSVVWLTPKQIPEGVTPVGEVTWTVAGIVQYSGERPLSSSGAIYRAWYHSWKANKYPRISVTADERVHGGVYCQIKYADASGVATVIDFSQRGPDADPGSVTCSTDLWVDQHFNKGERIAP